MKHALLTIAFVGCGFVVGCGSDGGATSSVVEDDVGSFAEEGVEDETGGDATSDATGDSMMATDTGTPPGDTGSPPADTGMKTDTGSDTGAMGAKITCGSTTCDPAAQVCCAGAASQSCIAKAGTCPAATAKYSCTQPADCPSGQVCCASGAGAGGASCATSCPTTTLCSTNADCTKGSAKTCKTLFTGIKYCGM
jgi:hypothetical protein